MISFWVGVCQVVSCLCVALGQNAWFPWCGPLAASFAFAIHWKTLDGLSRKQASRVSFLWFFIVSSIQLSWMTDITYQGVSILVVYLLIALGCAWQFSFLTKKIKDTSNVNLVSILGLCSLWTLMEWSRLHFLCGFAFNFVGLSLSCHLYSLQLASLFGVLGLSFWVMMTNLLGFRFLRNPKANFFLFQWLFVIFLPYIYGGIHVTYQDYRKEKIGGEDLSVLLVQTGLLPSEKYRIKGKENHFIHPIEQWKTVLEKIKAKAKQKIDVLVLPEAAFPFGLDRYVYDIETVQAVLLQNFGQEILSSFPSNTKPFVQEKFGKIKVSNAYWMQTLSNFFKTELIAGLDTEEEGKNYNAAFFFEPGLLPRRYDKRVLLPLAEYIPFNVLRKLSQKYGINDFFTPGKRSQVFGDNKASPSICYDELFSSIMREGKKEGAELFVNLSNDGWFPFSKLSRQHFAHGLIRTVENGIPLIRACGIGITGAVDSVGRVIAKLEENEKDALFVRLPKYCYTTSFSLWGETPLLVVCGIFCLITFYRNPFFRKTCVNASNPL